VEVSAVSESRPRVLIAYNEPVLPLDHPDAASEQDILETVVEVEKVLPADVFDVARLGYARHPRELLGKLESWKPDVVFNLFEGEADRTETEATNAALLEWLGVSFTGSGSVAIALGRDKVRSKLLFEGAGVPTAAFRVVESPPASDWPHPWPAIVKPACQDCSVGIDQRAVVNSQAEMEARVAYLFDRLGGPVLVEQYIPGREFHVHVVEETGTAEMRVLPVTEIRFELTRDDGYWPVYTYEGKWNEASVEYKRTPLVTCVDLPEPLWKRVAEVSRAAYRLIGLRDYGRVDLRVTPDGEPYLLEVNPNPYLNSIALVDGLKAVGGSFPEFVRGLVRRAAGRV
jgi:D-alanine-D-alanine ligase